ncbi:MAG: peptidoglycan-binding protein [Clostridia bacterium]|nr:peptidoglycan-binding protein [Clostridia bacterium]
MQKRPNERQTIAALQRYLRQLAFDGHPIPQPPVDGIFDTRTEQALRAYQVLAGLAVTGVADAITWERLFADYEASLERNQVSEGLDLFPSSPQDYVLYPEEEHFLVEAIQFILNELRLWYDDIPPNGQSGVFDDATRQGIIAFQKRQGLTVNASVDRITWNALARDYRRLRSRNEQ